MGQVQTHQSVINRPNPVNQHQWAEKNDTAYKWFYVALGFAGVVLALIILAYCYLSRKNSRRKDEEDQSSNEFLKHSESEQHKSFEPTVTTAKVQPKSEMSYEKENFNYPSTGKGMNFGSFSNVPQQPPSSSFHHHPHQMHHQMQMQNDHLLEKLEDESRKSVRSNSNNDTGSGTGSLSKMDSIDMYLNDPEKTPLQQRLEAQNGFSSYLHITPSELSRLNSLPEDVSDMSTLPISNASRNNSK